MSRWFRQRWWGQRWWRQRWWQGPSSPETAPVCICIDEVSFVVDGPAVQSYFTDGPLEQSELKAD